MFTRSNFELKVGIFIFIGIVILSVIVFSTGNFYGIKKGYTMTVLFSFANGISVGAPVRYAGVEVGEVQDIEVYFDEKENIPMVKLGIWVSRNTWINEDAKATINTLGLLGEKYLEVIPGTSGAKLLKQGGTLRGYDPISTEELTRETKETLAKVDHMIESITKIVGDEETRTSIKNTVSSLENTVSNLEDVSLDIKKHPWKLLFRPKESRKKKK